MLKTSKTAGWGSAPAATRSVSSRLRSFNWRPVGAQLFTVAVTLFGLLVLTFVIGRMMPADPVRAIVGEDATRETYEMVYEQLGLGRPLWEQFFLYLGDVLTGNFGMSIRTGQPVIKDILHVLPATIELATFAIIIGATLGVTLGVLAAVNKDRWPDHVIRVFSLMGHSMPIFWTGMIGLLLFYAALGWVGGSGRMADFYIGLVEERTGFLLIDSALARDWEVFRSALNHLILPASILGYSSSAYITRMTRSFMLDQINQEYITTARVKGLSARRTIWRHAFLNIRVQLVTIVALAYGSLLEGAVLIETVFAWPGFGQYLTNNLLIGDMNAVMTCVLIVGVIFIALNLISDMLYRIFDPRTR
ncbi:ABC transporter permease [Limoniibacter endophyticus]|uniref:ABC transporter permease n=1 Tax=Limoniibacter endophyticus TaxID=1565040 RepID=A0A8J3DIZ4_9HYPH|nr:ABC transporter permease [Limoniibacter endophyticus]GHC72008.1 ABC transporter permease [Limoniibacter endophyticus]